MKHILFCCIYLPALFTLADDPSLLQVSPSLQNIFEKQINDIVDIQGQKPKFAGDDPKTAATRKVDWLPRMWVPYLNGIQTSAAAIVGEKDKTAAANIMNASHFYIRIGRSDPTSSDIILSPEDAWQILLPTDNLYWNSGDTWHTDVLMEADNGYTKLRVIKKGDEKAVLLDAWPTRVSTWMGWSEKNGDFAVLNTKLGNKPFTAVVIPRRIFNSDITDIVILRNLDFPEKLMSKIREKEGPSVAAISSFAFAEQLWDSQETDHVALANKLFGEAAEYWESTKQMAKAKRARYHEVGSLLLEGYLVGSVRDGRDASNPVEQKRGRVLVEKALEEEKAIGESAVMTELTGDFCLRLAQAAFQADSAKAAAYLSCALGAHEPMTGLGKIAAIALRLEMEQKAGNNAAAEADVSNLEDLLADEEKSLNAAAKAASGDEKMIDPFARPDLYMRATEWNSLREIFFRLKFNQPMPGK